MNSECLNHSGAVAAECRLRTSTQRVRACRPTARIDSETIRSSNSQCLFCNLAVNTPVDLCCIGCRISHTERCCRGTLRCQVINLQPRTVVHLECCSCGYRRTTLRSSGFDGYRQRKVTILEISLGQGYLDLLVNHWLIRGCKSQSTGCVAVRGSIGGSGQLKHRIFPTLANRYTLITRLDTYRR